MYIDIFFLMIRRPPRSTRTDTLFPYTTLVRSEFTQRVFRSRVADRHRDPLQQQSERRALPHQQLAPQKVERLNAIGSFMDRVQTVVAIQTLDRIVARVAVATEHLDRELVRSEERRVGKECVSTCRSRWSPYH